MPKLLDDGPAQEPKDDGPDRGGEGPGSKFASPFSARYPRRGPRRFQRAWRWIADFPSRHSSAHLAIKSFAKHAMGLFLPTIACGLLLWFAGTVDFLDYFASEFLDSALAVSAAILLCTEMVSMDFPSEEGHLRYAAGIILLAAFLIIVCGMTVYDELGGLAMEKGLAQDIFVAVSPPSRGVNLLLAGAVCTYLAVNDVAVARLRGDDLSVLPYGADEGFDYLMLELEGEVEDLREETEFLARQVRAMRVDIAVASGGSPANDYEDFLGGDNDH